MRKLWTAALALACTSAMFVPGEVSSAASIGVGQAGSAGTGTAYWAEPPATAPNWIFPFASIFFYSTANVNDFQWLMYRPLYWLSYKGVPGLSPGQSLAKPPQMSSDGSTVTIPLKGWKWSNGTVVDAQSVMFFFNMLRAEKVNFAGYAPGELPDNIQSVTAPSAGSLTVTIHFKHGYNDHWMLFNELSQITPMPLVWDVSRLGSNGKPAPPGSGGCSVMTWNSTTAAHCVAVWKFMTDDNGQSSTPHEAGDLATYASNPLWQVVDGPWRLSSFDAGTGQVAMEPNSRFSGPKPHIAKFVEVPFTSDMAEYNALVNHTVTVGYLPVEDAPAAPSPGQVGPNPTALAHNYNIAAQFMWDVNYFPINFNSNGDGGVADAIFRQLYIRQVLQELVDQPAIIKSVDKNYAVPVDGPVPSYPATSFLSSGEKTNPYPYSQSTAATTLAQHGWSVVPGGTDACLDAAKCGAGIPVGAKLSFTLVYDSGSTVTSETVNAMLSSWQQEGIAVHAKAEPFNQVIATASPCKHSQSACSWELADWGGGWLYEPDYYPSGEYLFATGAPSNGGSYSDTTADNLITGSVTLNQTPDFTKYENYIAAQLPVVWQPGFLGSIAESSKKIAGVNLSCLLTLNPEDWTWVG